MFNLTEKKIHRYYDIFKGKAKKTINKGCYDACLRYIQAAAHIGYSFYLGFKDDELEDLLVALSKHIHTLSDNKERKNDECVFVDSFSIDNGGLIQQYLGAAMSLGYRIRYIAFRDVVLKESSSIGKMLRGYGNAEIIVVPSGKKPLENAQFVYDKIMETQATRLFIHTNPTASIASCAFYALPSSITKYKINLTDHTFWIGTRFIDYSLEFRPYGCVASIKQRGLKREQMLYLPFYPIMNRSTFKGFPQEADGKLILFSGGAYYKIFDNNDTYFKLVKAILDANPNMILLFAGAGEEKLLKQKIEQYQLSERFMVIGHRSDITEVFENCDIYLNTYPFGGGLMTQFAAQMGKPIVNYHTSNTALAEEFVCQLKQINISDNTIEGVVARVNRLASSKDFRKSYGAAIQECVVSPDKFNQLFNYCIQHSKSPVSFEETVSFEEHEMHIEDKLAFENSHIEFQRSFIKIFGISSLWECPIFLFNSIVTVIKDNRFLSVVKNNI